MNSDRYPILYGYSGNKCVELHGVNEVAKFICTEGLTNDLTITTPFDTLLLNTFGTFINQITDMEYREELLKVLIPMQHEAEAKAFGYSPDDDSETIKKEFKLADGKVILADDAEIDVSHMNFFDELEYESWDLFLKYCDAIGIEVEDRDEPDWYTAKSIQDKVLDVIMESGIKLKFDNSIEEENETEMGMNL